MQQHQHAMYSNSYFHIEAPNKYSFKLFNRVNLNESNKMLRPLIILTCFSLLTYQTYYLINDYREYSTVVNIKIVKAKISDHPSVSICYTSGDDIALLLAGIEWAKQNEREYPFALKFNQMFQEILNNEKLSASEKRNTLFKEGLIMFYVELARRNLTKVAKMRFWIEFDGFPGKKIFVIAMQSIQSHYI